MEFLNWYPLKNHELAQKWKPIVGSPCEIMQSSCLNSQMMKFRTITVFQGGIENPKTDETQLRWLFGWWRAVRGMCRHTKAYQARRRPGNHRQGHGNERGLGTVLPHEERRSTCVTMGLGGHLVAGGIHRKMCHLVSWQKACQRVHRGDMFITTRGSAHHPQQRMAGWQQLWGGTPWGIEPADGPEGRRSDAAVHLPGGGICA